MTKSQRYLTLFCICIPAIAELPRLNTFWTGLAAAFLLMDVGEWMNARRARRSDSPPSDPTTSVFYKAGRWFAAK